MRDELTNRAVERVTLACKALSAAIDDLAAARRRDGVDGDTAAEELEAERERVCELGEHLAKRAEGLIAVPATDGPHNGNGRTPRAAPSRRAPRLSKPRSRRAGRSPRSASR